MEDDDIDSFDSRVLFTPGWVYQVFKVSDGYSGELRKWQALETAERLEALGFEVVISRFDDETYLVGHRFR